MLAGEEATAREQEGEEEAGGQPQQAPKAKRALLSSQHFGARPSAPKPSPRILPAWV
jgi:hypothetical protein